MRFVDRRNEEGGGKVGNGEEVEDVVERGG